MKNRNYNWTNFNRTGQDEAASYVNELKQKKSKHDGLIQHPLQSILTEIDTNST